MSSPPKATPKATPHRHSANSVSPANPPPPNTFRVIPSPPPIRPSPNIRTYASVLVGSSCDEIEAKEKVVRARATSPCARCARSPARTASRARSNGAVGAGRSLSFGAPLVGEGEGPRLGRHGSRTGVEIHGGERGRRSLENTDSTFPLPVDVGESSKDKVDRSFPSLQSRVSPKNSLLCWIRKDLFESRTFSAADCFPVEGGDRVSGKRRFLGAAKTFSFSRDLWSASSGKPTFVEVVKMAGARGVGQGRYGAGRGRHQPTVMRPTFPRPPQAPSQA